MRIQFYMVISKFFKNKFLRDFSFFEAAALGLGFSHLVTAVDWYNDRVWGFFDANNFRAHCYSFFPSCTDWALENPLVLRPFVVAYVILSILILVPIVLKKRKWVYSILLGLFVFKASLFLTRYNIIGNYHTMHLTLSMVFLLAPFAPFIYRIALCLQYFWAGSIKLNLEWLSGAALVKDPLYFSNSLHLLSLGYVVVLELVLVWGLLSRNAILRRMTLIQLLFFHVYSYFVVGFLYPLIMAGILLPLFVIEMRDQDLKIELKKNLGNWLAVAFVVLVCVVNVLPKLQDGDPSKDGAIRHLSLCMLDSKTQCNTKLYQVFEDGNVRSMELPRLGDAIRVRCDPLLFEGYLRGLCRQMESDPKKSKLHFHLETRRYTESFFTPVRSYHDVCKDI